MINLAKDNETWRIELKTLSSQRRKSTQIGFFALLTNFILFGKGNCKTNKYLNWSFRALHTSQPRHLLHEMLTKMLSAESPDNQPVGTSADMEMSVGVREQLCMGFSWACKHLCRIRELIRTDHFLFSPCCGAWQDVGGPSI